jgi:hypothetical protein
MMATASTRTNQTATGIRTVGERAGRVVMAQVSDEESKGIAQTQQLMI